MAGLKGKTGIVTGGSSGIGFQIANVLAQAGATVYVISRTGKPKEGVGESAPGVVHLQGDIGNAEAMKTLVAELAAKHNDCLNFLVNNAGVSYKCRAEDFPMLLNGSLYPHLMEVEQTAESQMQQTMQGLLKQNPAPDKEQNQMAWVQQMNSLRAQAEELVLMELIYS